MELRTFAQIGILNRVTAVPSFNLQVSPCKSFYLHRREKHFEVIFVDYTTRNDLTDDFTLYRSVLEYPSDWPTDYLSKDKEPVFASLSVDNYVDVLLNVKWNPQAYRQKPSVAPLKIEFSGQSNGNQFLAVLVSSGAFHLYRRVGSEWIAYCNIGSAHVDFVKGTKMHTHYDHLKMELGLAEIISFDWLTPKGDEFPLLWVTKNGTWFSGTYNSTTEELTIKQEPIEHPDPYSLHVLSTKDKGVKEEHKHLIVVSQTGELSLNALTESPTQLTLSKTTDLWTETDNIFVSCIAHQFHEGGLRVFVVKGFYLIVFELNAQLQLQNTIVERFACPFVTGLHLIDDHQFIVALVNQRIMYGTVMWGKITLVDIQNEFDPNYSCSGLAYAHNKAIWMFAMTASKPNDYTVLKQPERILFATLTQFSPFQIVLDDPGRRIANHLDYFEMVRARKSTTSHELTKLQDRINKSEDMDETLYLLKIQWCLLHVAMRAKKKTDGELVAKVAFVRDIIIAVRLHGSLEALMALDSRLDTRQLTAILNIRIFLRALLESPNHFDHSLLVQRLEKRFTGTINQSKLFETETKPDQCVLCDDPMVAGKLHCTQIHHIKRCGYTNLQVPLMTIVRCRICGMQSLDTDTINTILGTALTRPLCSTCDVSIE